LAATGSGEPPKTVKIDAVSTYASVWLENLGAFCDVDIISPANWISPYIKRPSDNPEIRIAIPSLVAMGIDKPVLIIVRTARGVRLVDLGIPPPVILDADGNVTNALIDYIPNCLYINVEYGIKWARAGGLLDKSVVNPPLEHPDWTTYLDDHQMRR
jgi:hypothetical protein